MMFLGTMYTLILLITVIFLLYKYSTRKFDYWEKRKVPYLKPSPFFGNFFDVSTFRITVGKYFENIYNQMINEPFFGIFVFDSPLLIVKSPELIKNIMVKDFQNFVDRCIVSSPHDAISQHMIFLSKGSEWKTIRTKVSPAFSSGKIKAMLPIVNDVGEELKKYLARNLYKTNIEAKELCAKYATDVITKTAFAVNAHSFEDENADFRRMGRLMFDFRWSTAIQQTSYFFFPKLVDLFHFKFLDPKVTKFLRNAFWNVVENREKNNIKGNDIIDIIMELRKNKDFVNEHDFDGDKFLAQAAQFFAAGFETVSSTVAYGLYEFCLHPDIQTKLREEIKSCSEKFGGFNMESLKSMKYLDMCVNEVLRKYPVLPFLDRVVLNDYQIPDTNIVIEKGTYIFIPMLGLHNDPKYWENPEAFDPERFSEENASKITPFSYLPFGEGPRNCIGARFGLIVTKLALCHILSEYEVERTAKTPVPIKFEPKSFVLASTVGLPMRFKKI